MHTMHVHGQDENIIHYAANSFIHSFIYLNQATRPIRRLTRHKRTCTKNRQTETDSQKPCNTENTTSLKKEKTYTSTA